MKLVIPEPSIELYKDGFEGHDLLGRKETGKRLSELVEKIEDPLVVALDGPWGSGKSFFLKCWVGEHLKEEYDHVAQTVYFDAFQHDYMDDPLIALTGVISERFENDKTKNKIWEGARQAASKLWRPALRIGLALGTAGATEAANAVVDAGLKVGSKELETAAENFWKKEDGKRAAVEAFRKALVELTCPDENGKPTSKLAIVIDELDRCRPDYSLAVLEVTKHFFAVPGVHFILGVNLVELGQSVRARYGDRIDAPKYLQKFVNLNVRFPKTANEHETVNYLGAVSDSMGISASLLDDLQFLLSLETIAEKSTIRDVQRILTRCVLLPKNFDAYNWPFRLIVLVAILIDVLEPTESTAFKAGRADEKSTLAFFGLPQEEKTEDDRPKSPLETAIHVYLADNPEPELVEDIRKALRPIHGDIRRALSRAIRDCLDQLEVLDT